MVDSSFSGGGLGPNVHQLHEIRARNVEP